MEHESFYATLDSLYPIGYPMRAYLNVVLESMELERNQQLALDHHERFAITFIERGNMKTALESLENPGRIHIIFHFKTGIVLNYPGFDPENFSIRTTATEQTRLTLLPAKHVPVLYRVFPEFHSLTDRIASFDRCELLRTVFDLQYLDAIHRLELMLAKKPDIFQIASVNDIAHHIGIHPHTLSTYRNTDKGNP